MGLVGQQCGPQTDVLSTVLEIGVHSEELIIISIGGLRYDGLEVIAKSLDEVPL